MTVQRHPRDIGPMENAVAGTGEQEKVSTVLSGIRALVIGVQILLGFQYRTVFQPEFPRQPPLVHDLEAGAFLLLVASLACIMAAAPFHRISEGGQATVRMHVYASVMGIGALAPFALAIGLNVVVALHAQLGPALSAAAGGAVALAAALCWFGPALARRGAGAKESDEMTGIKDRIDELLTEVRIVLPGVQALLGFQFTSYLTQGFERLPPAARAMNTVSLFLLLGAMVLLMTPAPTHRLAERGENTPWFERVAEALVLAPLPLLALAIAGDLYVVLAAVRGADSVAALVSAGCAAGMLVLWLGVPWASRLLPPGEAPPVAAESEAPRKPGAKAA